MIFFDGDIECPQLMLRIILNKPDLRVIRVESQKNINTAIGRGVCLDVLATDVEGILYNIDVQRAKDGADICRAILNNSLPDTEFTLQGQKFTYQKNQRISRKILLILP